VIQIIKVIAHKEILIGIEIFFTQFSAFSCLILIRDTPKLLVGEKGINMYTIDNDRPDIQKAYWQDQGKKTDNYYNKMRIDVPIASYAENAKGVTKLSDVVTRLVHQGGGTVLYNKQHLFLDIDWDQIEEYIALQTITPNGWDHPLTNSEDIVVTHRSDYCMCNIYVELFDSDS
jgi:hypothetical protein